MDLKLGKLIDENQQRDAIHIAVAPVVAAQRLAPGQDIGFVTSSTERVGVSTNPIGIVDPFLKSLVYPDQRFWMFLYPQTITSLRHDWTHPAFGATVADKVASEQWMRDFADRCGLTFDEVLAHTASYLHCGVPWVQQGTSRVQGEYWSVRPEFWRHYEALTGRTVAEDDKEGAPFSCSC